MAAAMISERGLRKKLTQEHAKESEKPPAKKSTKRKSTAKSHNGKSGHEQNNNQSKKPKVIPTGDSKADLLAAYQPWVIQTYGDLAKTKTITLRKYARILRTLRGEECNSSDSSKFRFWVKAKGFYLGKPAGYDAKPADGIVCRYSVLDVDEGPEAIERCSGSANDPALYIPTAPVKNATSHDPVYRKVAIVENFFDIIYTVHVDLEGRAGKHAGQKRTYRTITETYAFLPREAVTRFLMGCIDCQRRPRSLSPSSVLPTPSPSPTPLSTTILPNGFHHLPSTNPKITDIQQKFLKNGSIEVNTKNWENEIDASQPSVKICFKDGVASFDTSADVRSKNYVNDQETYQGSNGVDLSSKSVKVDFNGRVSPASSNLPLFDSSVSAFRSVRKESSACSVKDESLNLSLHDDELASSSSAQQEPINFRKTLYRNAKEDSIKASSKLRQTKTEKTKSLSILSIIDHIDTPEAITSLTLKDEKKASEKAKKHKDKHNEIPSKPYNPLDVCNLTSKDPPKSRSPPKKRHLNPMYNVTDYKSGSESKSFPKPWSPSMQSMFSPHRSSTESSGSSQHMGKNLFQDMEIDYSVPITTTYLKHMRTLGFGAENSPQLDNKRITGCQTLSISADISSVQQESLHPDPTDITDDDQFSGSQLKDADKLKLMILAWNIHSQNRGRNGEASEGVGVGGDANMAELWASYHSALGLAGSGRRNTRDQPSPVMLGAGGTEPGGLHDETSSSAGNGKEDDDALGSDDESDERLDPQQHDPERLKAFNMFVRLFVDENLDRIVPISKQPKEKIQAIIDSCTRQFPEFAERARKRIRTYLKSCRRNKKVRGETPQANSATTPAWDATIRPTPAHLTSVQAEQILAQACENESHNAKRMRLGLEPVSQPMPTSNPGSSIDTTASSAAVTHPLLGLYNSTVAAAQLQAGSSPGMQQSKGDSAMSGLPNILGSSLQNSGLENGICLNNNNISKGQNDVSSGGGGSKNASPASSPAPPLPLFRSNFPQAFGQHQTFGRQSSRTSTPLTSTANITDLASSLGVNSSTSSAIHGFGSHLSATNPLSLGASGVGNSTNALLSSLGAVAGLHNPSVGGSSAAAAVAAYQSALFSAAMAAGGHHGQALNFGGLGVALTGNGPTDLSMKTPSASAALSQASFSSSLSSVNAASALGLNPPIASASHAAQSSSKPLLLSHKLNSAEMAAVRQLITGYRESAAFLLRSADELETLLLQQP